MFRKTNYSILQKTATTSWNDLTDTNLKRSNMPARVYIDTINLGATSDSGVNSPTLVFTSTNRVKKSDDSLVPLGAGAGSLRCGNIVSPLDGKRIFVGYLKSEVTATNSIWFRVEIDTSGEFFVCTMISTNGSQPDFSNSGANILEL